MIPKELYPTPAAVAWKMARLVDFKRVESILEPSAGNGDLAKATIGALNAHRYRGFAEKEDDPFLADVVDVIEIDEKCRAYLKSQKANVVAEDFLKFQTFKRYDLIIMNPPFSDGVKHILKAIEMQKYGGQIVCLLNSETINNPYTLERKVLAEKIAQYDGKVYDYGQCFSRAERPTDVNICCVYIDIPKGAQSDILDGLEKASKAEEQENDDRYEISSELDEYMRAIVGQYRRECEAGLKLINEFNAISKIALTSFKDGLKQPILELRIYGDRYSVENTENRFLERVRYKYWEAFFARPEICKKMTGKMQEEFYSRLDELKKIEFSLDNIYELQIRMTKNTIGSVEDAIMDLFHEFTRDHSWFPECAKNIHHYYNGWATNRCGVINKKVIIPLGGFSDSWGGGKHLSLDYRTERKLADIEKVFSYLDTGITDCWESVTDILAAARSAGQSQNIEFKYFTVTFYKKGTTHITFKNMELLKRFNIFAGQREGGLPPSYGKKSYSDMTEREKEIIDEFQGEADYNEVYQNSERYVVTAEMLAIEMQKSGG